MCAMKKRNGHTYVQWRTAVLANVSVFVYGFENAWISPMTRILQSPASPTGEPLSDYDISWIASLMCFAAVFSTPAYSYLADRFGRKVAVTSLLLPQAISWGLKLYPTLISLALSRVFGGIAAGGCFNVVPMYVKEISQDSIRGNLGSLLILTQNLGVLGMYIIGAYLDYYTVQYTIIGIPILTVILMIKAPEAPAFLIKRGEIDKAIETVAFLRGLDKDDKRVLEEIAVMQKQEDYFQSLPKVSVLSLVTDERWRRSVIIVAIAGTLHGCNGAYAIVVYAAALLTQAGSDFAVSPEIQSFSFPIVMIISCMLLTVFAERVGRKVLLITAYVVSAVSFAVLASAILGREYAIHLPGWLPLLMMAVNVFAYAGGVSSLTYIIMTEIFSFQIRGRAMGSIVTYIWLMESLQLLSYAPVASLLGSPALFFMFTAVNAAGALFVLACVPETKARSEDEIQDIIRGKNKENTNC